MQYGSALNEFVAFVLHPYIDTFSVAIFKTLKLFSVYVIFVTFNCKKLKIEKL